MIPPPLPICNALQARSPTDTHRCPAKLENSVRLAARAVVTAADDRRVDVAVGAAFLLGRLEPVRTQDAVGTFCWATVSCGGG